VIHISILMRGIHVFSIQGVMFDFVVPVLADDPLAYCPVLMMLYLCNNAAATAS